MPRTASSSSTRTRSPGTSTHSSASEGASVATIHLKQTTTATAEQYVAGLTDFGPGRSQLFSNSADDQLVVHSESAHHADVTEGSGSAWERLDYDWSDPRPVVALTPAPNIWGAPPAPTYLFGPRHDPPVRRTGGRPAAFRAPALACRTGGS